MPRPTVEFEDAECVKETDAAICCSIVVRGADREVWFPKSVLSKESDVMEEGDRGILVVHEWFCLKEDLL